ncbi:flagellar export chaperone FliS [Alkalihalobacillus sp. AL-G]|uniref:flagellar export chaperone FliS n=1 Tax=Alkalihalobacillus sp. AL-G TaxID=2926399 RepID=UPI002729F8BE|nr:flagellar export chaperone FliS [Alkalihalobacillus sp. AL-G]WLD92965.1 flagellar export chaperone FliS [Alkalihalobacillus sp. AL-G]
MSLNNPYKAYQQNSVGTASPGELTLMLYNGCLKFLKQAKTAIQDNKTEDKNTNLIKAQKIIQELMVTLNTEVAVGEQMLQMYDYMNRRLVEANIKSDISIIEEVEGLTIEFRDTWKQVIQMNRKANYGAGGQA